MTQNDYSFSFSKNRFKKHFSFTIKKKVFSLISKGLALFILAGCAVYEPTYSLDALKWEEDYQLPNDTLVYTFFLVGDAGKPESSTGQNTMALLEKKLAETEGKQGVVFLGDNVYPSGIPDSSSFYYETAVSRLKGQLKPLEGYEGEVVFLPGNHDWRNGRLSLKRQDDIVEETLGEKKLFLPDWGCGGPEDKDLTDEIVLLAIDSQWWMEDWDGRENFNKGCAVSSRSAFIVSLKDELGGLKDKTVILAMHHPMRSVGPHGGQYSLKREFFPATDLREWLYIPMPLFGGLLRRNLGVSQDLTNPRYARFVEELKLATEGFDNIIFAAGHEHTLQHIEDDQHPYIISGAGAKQNPARAGGQAKYASGQGGLAELKFYKNGAIWVQYWNGQTGELDYAKEIFKREPKEFNDFEIYERGQDSIRLSIYEKERYPGWFHRAIWGKFNREMYYDSVTVPVFDFEKMPGNLRTVKKGGGNQTNSLRLENDEGEQYVLRSVRKDGNRILGGVFQGTFIVDLLEDIFTYTHPFAAFTLPDLAEASDIYHTNPKLYYLPKQPKLGDYNDKFGNDFYLFEERPDDDRSDVASFGNSKNIISTDDLMEELMKSWKNNVDEDAMMRARMFDFMIGDWDRHQDNWRWAGFPDDTTGGEFYRPIPRDRDQVYANFDGFMIKILNQTGPQLRQFHSYKKGIRNIKWYGEYPKFYDRRFIAPVPWEVWEEQARIVQKNTSDSLIEASIRKMPPEAFARGGEKIVETMKYRRDNLVEIVREYYELLAKDVEIVGTEDEDVFEIERLSKDSTRITQWVVKDDERHQRYRRVFLTDETQEVRLYGMEGDDTFELTGEVKDGIKIRAIGGYGDDFLKDESRVRGWGRKTKMYDFPGGMSFQKSKETDNDISERYDINNYEFKDYGRNYGIFLPTASYGPDFGFALGISYLYFGQEGFKKRPFNNKQTFKIDYAFGNESFQAAYEGIFYNVFGTWALAPEASYRAPRFTFNYFGIGNETVRNQNLPRTFNQVRQQGLNFGIGFRKPFKSEAGYFEVKPFYQNLKIENTAGRFIEDLNADPDRVNYLFETIQLTGADISFVYDSRDFEPEPRRGMLVDFGAKYTNDFERNQGVTNLTGALTFYQRLDASGSIIWATQVGTEHVFGDDYLIFQSATIGGLNSLRGFRQGRFRGETSFRHVNDIRANFGRVRNPFLPFKVGVFGSFDHGRVWAEEAPSRKWHYTYGGGLFVNVMERFVASLGYHRGDVDGQFLGGIGFNF